MSASLSACSGSQEENETNAPITAQTSRYVAEIAPVLAANCATCHLTGQEAGNVVLVPAKAIESLVGVPSVQAPGLMRVVPGDPDASYLVMKLEGSHIASGGTGSQMPFGAPPLPRTSIAKIRQWITEGAKP